MRSMDARLTDLEIRYAHLERQYAELSQVVFEQQKVIDAMSRELRGLRGRVDELGEPAPNDKPPHY